MRISIRADSVLIEGYVNAVERDSKPLMSRIGRFIERICKGAFFNALKRNDDVHILLNHEWSRDLGSTKQGNLELTEDNIGLHARAIITDSEAIEKARRGDLVGWSFGFLDLPNGVERSQVDGLPLRKVRDMDLREVSILDRTKSPAYYITVANIHNPETTSLLVRKEWDDNNNQDGIRPESIYLDLLVGGEQERTFELTEDTVDFITTDEETGNDVWWFVIRQLPVYRDGKKINYVVVEESIADYTKEVLTRTYYDYNGMIPEEVMQAFEDALLVPEDASDDEKQDALYKALEHATVTDITNVHVPGETSIMVTKVWKDDDNLDGVRPASVAVDLEAGYLKEDPDTGEKSYVDAKQTLEDMGISTTVWLYDFNQWTDVFAHLPMFLEGSEVSYFVTEQEVPYYEASYSTYLDTGYFTITNTHKTERVDHTVTVKWEDNNNQDGLRPAYVNVYLMKDGVRTDDPVVTLSAANGWTYTWKDLPSGKYDTVQEPVFMMMALAAEPADAPAEEEAGNGVTYSADAEEPVDPDVYTKTSVTTEDNQTTIVYTYEPKTMEIKGNKIWEDNNNQDGVRPESITVNLYADGHLVKTLEVTAESATDEAGNIWSYEFTELPRYIDGNLVHYSVSEEAVPNYSLRIVGYDLYNTYNPGQTFVTAIKLWNDDRNRDGLRPDNIIVRLMADGEEVNRASISQASGWFTIFTNLPLNKDGKEIEYTIVEDAVDGYTSEISGDAKAGFVITNTHTSETTSLEVTKVWNDNDNEKGKRPESITVYLLVNNQIVATAELTAAEGWSKTFTDLPKNSNGQPVIYTVVEAPVANYTPTVVGTTIINTYTDPCCKPCKPHVKPNPVEPSGKGSPKTGDVGNLGAMALVSLLAAAAALVLIKRREELSK